MTHFRLAPDDDAKRFDKDWMATMLVSEVLLRRTMIEACSWLLCAGTGYELRDTSNTNANIEYLIRAKTRDFP